MYFSLREFTCLLPQNQTNLRFVIYDDSAVPASALTQLKTHNGSLALNGIALPREACLVPSAILAFVPKP